MPSNVMTTGNTAATADIVLLAGEVANVCLKGEDKSDASVGIYRLDDVGNYNRVGDLKVDDRDRLLLGPGTYRVSRAAGVTCGVFRD